MLTSGLYTIVFMKKLHSNFLLLVFLVLVKTATAQTDLAIGQWKEHLPFSNATYVTQSDDKVFYATRYAVLEVDKQEHSIRRLTKVEGLSDVGVSLIKYNQGSKTLVIVYNDGKIDLVTDEGTLTLPALANAQIIGGKKVFDIYMADDSIAYIAASYGITTLNLRQGLFPNTIKTPVEARSVRIFQGKIYAATDDGLYAADPNAGYNINDFSNWEWLNGTLGLPQNFESDAMTLFNGKLYLDVNDSLYHFDGNSAGLVFNHDAQDLTFLSAEGEHLVAGYFCGTTCKGAVFSLDKNETATQIGSDCLIFPRYAIEDAEGTYWYADDVRNFHFQEKNTACNFITVNSPYSINVYQLDAANGKVWVAAGGVDLTYSAVYRTDGFFELSSGDWRSYSLNNRPELAGISDFLDIKTDPKTGKVYAAAFLDALVCYDPATDQFQVFNDTNSTLQGAQLDETRTRVTGLAFDAEGNLWVCNHNAPKPLAMMTPTGEWHSFGLSCVTDDQMSRLVVDGLGRKWLMSSGNSTGIVVFDEGEDLNSSSDDKCVVLNSSNSELPTNEITSLEVDRDGSVWVGTKLGAAVFQCDPFSGECPGSRPFVTVDGFGANLLEDIEVKAIAVDGANRKWFGTGAGVFVMSPEGNEQIARFTAENSPLFDNAVTDIDFNDETGEVYIGTQRGLISYRTEATAAPGYHTGALVFPNPVRENYHGPIAIKGLAEDSTVKITDVSGQLVYETEALGGQAIWDGNDYKGRRANTGVYLVYATNRNANDPQVAVAKILLIK